MSLIDKTKSPIVLVTTWLAVLKKLMQDEKIKPDLINPCIQLMISVFIVSRTWFIII